MNVYGGWDEVHGVGIGCDESNRLPPFISLSASCWRMGCGAERGGGMGVCAGGGRMWGGEGVKFGT